MSNEEKLKQYYSWCCKKISQRIGPIESGDAVLIRKTLEQTLEHYKAEFLKKEDVPIGLHFMNVHNCFLREYGLEHTKTEWGYKRK